MKHRIKMLGTDFRIETTDKDSSVSILVSKALVNPGYLFTSRIEAAPDVAKGISDIIMEQARKQKYKGVIFRCSDPVLEKYLISKGCIVIPDSETIGPEIHKLVRYDI